MRLHRPINLRTEKITTMIINFRFYLILIKFRRFLFPQLRDLLLKTVNWSFWLTFRFEEIELNFDILPNLYDGNLKQLISFVKSSLYSRFIYVLNPRYEGKIENTWKDFQELFGFSICHDCWGIAIVCWCMYTLNTMKFQFDQTD